MSASSLIAVTSGDLLRPKFHKQLFLRNRIPIFPEFNSFYDSLQGGVVGWGDGRRDKNFATRCKNLPLLGNGFLLALPPAIYLEPLGTPRVAAFGYRYNTTSHTRLSRPAAC